MEVLFGLEPKMTGVADLGLTIWLQYHFGRDGGIRTHKNFSDAF